MESKSLPTVELCLMKTVMRLFEYKEYKDRGLKKINGGYSNTSIESFDAEHVYFTLTIGARDGKKDNGVTEHYRIKRAALLEDTTSDDKLSDVECMDVEIVEQAIISPEEMLSNFRIEQGAIVLPEGLHGRYLKQVNNTFKLRILKKKRRRVLQEQAEEVHQKMSHSILLDKIKSGKLRPIGRHPKN